MAFTEEELRNIVTRHGAEVVSCTPVSPKRFSSGDGAESGNWYISIKMENTNERLGFSILHYYNEARIVAEMTADRGEPYRQPGRSRGGCAGGLDGSRWDD